MALHSNLKALVMAAFLVAGIGQTEARRHFHYGPRPYHYYGLYPARIVVTPAPRPVVASRVTNRFSRKERLAMAVAYLDNHETLTAKQYAKITSLNKDAAEAELDAFVMDSSVPIISVIKGKKKLYVKAGCVR